MKVVCLEVIPWSIILSDRYSLSTLYYILLFCIVGFDIEKEHRKEEESKGCAEDC